MDTQQRVNDSRGSLVGFEYLWAVATPRPLQPQPPPKIRQESEFQLFPDDQTEGKKGEDSCETITFLEPHVTQMTTRNGRKKRVRGE